MQSDEEDEGSEVWEVFGALEADLVFEEGPARMPGKHTAKRRGWLPDFHDQVYSLPVVCFIFQILASLSFYLHDEVISLLSRLTVA
jgi:hypothetical protein